MKAGVATKHLTDAWIREQYSDFERMIDADGAVFNIEFMNSTATYHYEKGALKGDQLICLLAMAPLTPLEGGPTEASDTLLAKRMTTLKAFFAFVKMVGSQRMCSALGLDTDGVLWA